MLKLVDVCKDYKVGQESVPALKHVSIEFRSNEFVAILGPSGCGKTTLLNIIGGLDRYTSGDIQIEGISTKEYTDGDWDTYRNCRIGFVFQSYNLIPHMNILKNVSLSLTLAGVGKEERNKRALEALAKVGLDKQARKRPSQLSGGQMQRVAIARALVNNPDIILADEPTGALDSESGIQVMDLLKEVAADRLVIMVTHNPQLAEQYSTRIVNLKDGEIEADSMPYLTDEKVVGDPLVHAEKHTDDVLVKAEKNELVVSERPPKTSIRSRRGKSRNKAVANRSAMKLSTAIGLSWNNLISKKGRTLLTSIAGSIGIIGIILVLALSNGASMYIDSLEESALSNYPISVNQNSLGIMDIVSEMMTSMTSDDGKVDDEVIKVQEVLGNLTEKLVAILSDSKNDLHSFKQYVDEYFDDSLASVKYNYGTTFNCYVEDRGTSEAAKDRYMKINPYTETMQTVLNQVLDMPFIGEMLKNWSIPIGGQSLNFTDAIGYLTSMLGSAWSEISSNTDMLKSQYELVGSRSRWPQSEDEIVIVVDQNNRIMDFQLFMLGLQSQDEVISAIANGDEFSAKEYEVDELLNLEYKVMNNVDYLDKDPASGDWIMHPRTEQSKEYVDSHCIKFRDGSDHLRVSAVVRPKPGAVASSISGIIGYTPALTNYLLGEAESHEAIIEINNRFEQAVEAGQAGYESPITYYSKPEGVPKTDSELGLDVMAGDVIEFADDSQQISHESNHFALLRQLGFADIEYPQSIEFYCSSFETKHAVEDFIAEYNDLDPSKQITYSDSLGSMMTFIDTMAETITGVLVAFAAISLVVSTIMIAIIIYTSVLERRKEIGVLRSIGARKKDISRVFIAESAILGGYSGVIGVIVSILISMLGSFILNIVFHISGLMTVTWWHCLLMLFISVGLSILAGFIPSRIAANKDPAIALRSE